MKKLKIAGNILMVIALVFVVRRLFSIDWTSVITGKNLFWFVLYIAVYTVIVLVSYYPWRILVSVFIGSEKSLAKHDLTFCYVFTKANILKYVPGNVFQYVGRNEVASILGLDHAGVAMATLSEVILMAASAALCSLVLIGSYTIQYLKAHLLKILAVGIAALVILSAAVFFLFKWKKEKVTEYYNKYKKILSKKQTAARLLLVFCIYTVIFLCIGLLFIAVMNLCSGKALPRSVYGMVIGGFILSWLAGYITPGAPGGIGVRELILSLVFSGTAFASQETIVKASALYRVINTFGDIIAFVIMFVVYHAAAKKSGLSAADKQKTNDRE